MWVTPQAQKLPSDNLAAGMNGEPWYPYRSASGRWIEAVFYTVRKMTPCTANSVS